MTGKTHLAAGALTGVVLSQFGQTAEEKAVIIAVSALGGLFPDVDIKGSTINKNAKVTSFIPLLFKHRGVLHTPIVYIVLSALIYLFIYAPAGIAFFGGAMSHIFLDCLNPTGIMLFYPFSKKYVHFAKIRTGQGVDMALCTLITIAALCTAGWLGYWG